MTQTGQTLENKPPEQLEPTLAPSCDACWAFRNEPQSHALDTCCVDCTIAHFCTPGMGSKMSRAGGEYSFRIGLK